MPELDNILQQLRAEREHSQAQLHRLNQAIAALEGVGPAESVSGKRGRRTLSAAARQRMADAQRRRWAKVRAKGTAKPARTRRSLSPAARARIVAAQKKRWAKFKAG